MKNHTAFKSAMTPFAAEVRLDFDMSDHLFKGRTGLVWTAIYVNRQDPEIRFGVPVDAPGEPNGKLVDIVPIFIP